MKILQISSGLDEGVASADAADRVDAVLSAPEDQLDYAAAKLAYDRIVDPAADIAAAAAELDRLTRTALQMAGGSSSPDWRFGALRTSLYERGAWNGKRPFRYDRADPDGQGRLVRLLPHYLRTRRGNCVSMPILFLILADRLGLDVALATAPLHMLVRYRDEKGRVHNIETTSGGHPAREAWLCRNFGIDDHQVRNGVYLRSLPRREALAHMASTVVEHLFDRRRFEQAVRVCEVILRHAPRDVYTMVKLGTACGYLFQAEFRDKYPAPDKAPREARERALALAARNQAMFAAAEALGWADETGRATAA